MVDVASECLVALLDDVAVIVAVEVAGGDRDSSVGLCAKTKEERWCDCGILSSVLVSWTELVHCIASTCNTYITHLQHLHSMPILISTATAVVVVRECFGRPYKHFRPHHHHLRSQKPNALEAPKTIGIPDCILSFTQEMLVFQDKKLSNVPRLIVHLECRMFGCDMSNGVATKEQEWLGELLSFFFFLNVKSWSMTVGSLPYHRLIRWYRIRLFESTQMGWSCTISSFYFAWLGDHAIWI